MAQLPVGMVVEEEFLAGPAVADDDLVRMAARIGDDRVLARAKLGIGLVLQSYRAEAPS